MEDQPADPGDLTTDAESPAEPAAEATDAAPRRKHRMPLRRQMDSAAQQTEDTAADVTPEATDITTEVVAEPFEAPQAKPGRRWFSRRRKSETPEPEVDSATDEVPSADEPAPLRPVGKSRRSAKPALEASEPEAIEVQADEEISEEPEGADTPDEEQILVPHRPAGKRLMIATAAAGVLFVGATAFAGATVQPYLADRASVDIKLNVARTAANAIATLWTYTPDNMEALPDRAAGFLGGDFANEYRKYIDAIVATNKQAQVTNITEVKGAAVETLSPSEATAIVYTNSVATSPVTKNIPSLRYLSYRLTMERDDAKWLITRMSTVTSFDLTPQL